MDPVQAATDAVLGVLVAIFEAVRDREIVAAIDAEAELDELMERLCEVMDERRPRELEQALE